MKIRLLIAVLMLAGCTTLHVDNGFYLDRAKLLATISPVCRRSGNYGDEAVVAFPSGEEVKVSMRFYRGLTVIGAFFVPILPIKFSDATKEIVLDIETPRGVFFDPERLSVRLDDGEWIPGKKEFVHPDWYASGKTEECRHRYPPIVRFPLPSSQSATRVVVKLAGLTSADRALPDTSIEFKREGRWHYEPIVMLHSEWPYSDLPCAH